MLPITSMALQHKVSNEVISTGVPDLDAMLGVGGYYRGSSVLMSGTAGTGKTTLPPRWRGRHASEESACFILPSKNRAQQIVRNMRFDRHRSAAASRQRTAADYRTASVSTWSGDASGFDAQGNRSIPTRAVVIVDPISNLVSAATTREVTAMLTLLIDFLKGRGHHRVFHRTHREWRTARNVRRRNFVDSSIPGCWCAISKFQESATADSTS